MKKFKAVKIEIVDDNGVIVTNDEKGNPFDISYKTFALNALRFPTSEIDAVKLCEITDVIRKIRPMEVNSEIELEDAEFQLLKDALLAMKFQIVSEDWADFIHYMKNQ